MFIASADGVAAARARQMIDGLTGNVELGGIYTGKVVRLTDFGAFVEIMPKTDGMVHISQLASEPVRVVEDVVRMGQEVTVMVIGNDNGKIRLSRKALLTEEGGAPKA